jgi:hypothetical protein
MRKKTADPAISDNISCLRVSEYFRKKKEKDSLRKNCPAKNRKSLSPWIFHWLASLSLPLIIIEKLWDNPHDKQGSPLMRS